jgi:predicted aldo/keto reductase-like oxidoreductase
MEGSHGTCGGGNRRRFLQTAAATGAALAASNAATPLSAAAVDPLPTTKLGKTGQTVTRLGMGSSWAVDPSFVQALLASGVRYIDTAEGYERGRSEKTIGQVLERTGKRKDVYLVTKTHDYGPNRDPKLLEGHLTKSLESLRTDYVDAYFLHGMEGRNIPVLKSPEMKAAFEAMKKSGKIRFAGFSCHDRQLTECIEAAAECGWLDQIMFQYNYRTMDGDALRRAIDTASKANIGLVAMKTQGGAGSFREIGTSAKFTQFKDKGFKKEIAAIKAVLTDERIHAVVSEMTNRDQLRENMSAFLDPLSKKDAALLEQHREATAHLYCHGCGHLCETAARGVPVATVLRYYRYYEVYGKREEARALYQALPVISRQLIDADLLAAQAACPHGLPVAELVRQADKRMS